MRIRKPPPLERDARLAITCPASPADPDALGRGAERLRGLGYEVVVGETCRSRGTLWAGSDEARAQELLGFLRDPSIGAVFAGRGGVGCMRILPRLDELTDATPPKWIVGRSDLTALQLDLLRRLGWVSLSGPMVAIDIGMESPAEGVLARTLRLLSDPAPAGRVDYPPAQVWRSGVAEGPLIPANLSLLASMVGTGRLPSLRGAILVLEEIDETPQRIDRMLTQLRLAGLLDGVVGLVVGQFTRCVARDPSLPVDLWRDVVRGHAAALDIPTLAGFPYGHEPAFEPLPVGVRARLSANPPGLEILESAVAAAP